MSAFWSAGRVRRVVSMLVAAVLAVPLVLVSSSAPAAAMTVPPVEPTAAAHVTADALPTVQINGVVWDQHIIGNTVYVVGEFTQARPSGSPAGVNETPRANMLAYDLTTGELITSFVANTNAMVRTVTSSPDGSRLYIGGLFTSVNGVSRYRIAALNPTTGAVITSFYAVAGYLVYDLVATSTTVYAGGKFTSAAGGSVPLQNRMNLAAFSATNGDLLPWAPSADDRVWTIAISEAEGRVFVGGMFGTVNGASRRGLAALDAATGNVLPFAANDDVWAIGPNGSYTDIKVANGSVYATAYTFGRSAGNIEGITKADVVTGEIEWLEDCHGDTYQVFPVNGYVYKASHTHFCGNIGGQPQSDAAVSDWRENTRHAMAVKDGVAGTVRRDNWSYHNLEGYPAPSRTSWAPDFLHGAYTGQGQATWSVTGNSEYVVYGGEFVQVNKSLQQGLTRFAVRSIAPNSQGPIFANADIPLNVVSPSAGQVRVSLMANFDRDDHDLTYQLVRNGAVVQTKVVASTFWDRPTVSFFESLPPGQTPSYRVRVADSTGNIVQSNAYPVTVAGSGSPTVYADQVIADDARIYWRLGDPVGSPIAHDSAALETGDATAMTFERPGAIIGDPDTAAAAAGSDSFIVQRPTQVWLTGTHDERHPAVDEFTVEIWFRTTSTQGGRLIGFGNSNSGTSSSSSRDRHLYVSDDGRVLFGVRTRPEGPGVTSARENRVVESAAGLNDGDWHHAVGSLNGDGMRLYIDGELVDTRDDVNSGHGYYGYWRVGDDGISSSFRAWPNRPTSDWLDGDLDEAAVYYEALSPAQVQNHWILSGQGGGVPVLSVDKPDPVNADEDGSGDVSLGDTLTYTITASNDGNVDLTNVVVSDPLLSNTTGSSPCGLVAPGGTCTLVGDYVVAEGDVTVGQIDNTATASSDQTSDATDTNTVTVSDPPPVPVLSVDKPDPVNADEDGSGDVSLGDTLTYTITASNDGNVDLTNVVVSDPLLSNTTGSSPCGLVAPGGTCTLVGDYVVAEGDVTVGQIDNTATASSDQTSDATDTNTVTVSDPPPVPVLSVDKPDPVNADEDGSGDVSLGDTLTYTITASNDGNVDLTNVVVSDPLLSNTTGSSPCGLVAPGGTCTLVGDYVVAEGDVTVGQIDNTATASSDQTSDATDTNTVTVSDPPPVPVLSVDKPDPVNADEDGSGDVSLGDTLTYTITASNDGNVDLTNVVVSDPLLSNTTGSSPCGLVAPGGTCTLVGDYVVAEGDVTVGQIDNTATASSDQTSDATDTNTVTVSEPGSGTMFAQDSFGRSVAGSWGSAEIGGAWSVAYGAPQYDVNGSQGVITSTPGQSGRIALPVDVVDGNGVVDISWDAAPTGGGAYSSLQLRDQGANTFYLARVRVVPTGTYLTLQRWENGSAATLANMSVPGLVYSPGDVYRLRFEIEGTSPTSVRAKLWDAAGSEPAGWQVTATDATAVLQQAGGLGLATYLSASASATTATAFDNLTLQSLGPVENVPPQAVFTADASGLDVSFDGSGSSDSDGSIVSYDWDFGDGTFDAGVMPLTKTYAASGTYDVTLTVTDDDGATNAVTQQVTVSEPGSGTMFAQDSFGRSVAGSWGSAEIGGAWSVAYGAPQYDVNGSQGVITSTPGQSGRIALPVDVVDGNGVVDISWDAAPTGGGAYSSLQLRDQGANTFYLARVRVVPTGTYLTLQRWENGSAATLANMSVPGLVYSPGDVYRLRFEIEGTSPTSVRAKLWDAAGSEPAGWQVTATDATAVLQQAGGLGLATYLSASASATTATAFDNLTLQSLVGG